MSSTPMSAGNLIVTNSDHGAYIVIVAVLGVTWSVLVLAIRLYIRLRLNGPFGPDDAAATLGTVSMCRAASEDTALGLTSAFRPFPVLDGRRLAHVPDAHRGPLRPGEAATVALP